MLANQIMTSPVTTIAATTPVREIAALMAKRSFSGVPVVDAKGQLLGIVSESDLMRGLTRDAGATSKWWLIGLSRSDDMARAYTKSHGSTAADLMTRHVATIRDDATLPEVAESLAAHGIKRLPVMRDGRLVGIITRRDLVHALARSAATPTASMSNASLQKQLLERMARERWLDASYVNVLVSDDVIELNGYIASSEQKRALEVLASEFGSKHRLLNKLEIGLPLVSDFA